MQENYAAIYTTRGFILINKKKYPQDTKSQTNMINDIAPDYITYLLYDSRQKLMQFATRQWDLSSAQVDRLNSVLDQGKDEIVLEDIKSDNHKPILESAL